MRGALITQQQEDQGYRTVLTPPPTTPTPPVIRIPTPTVATIFTRHSHCHHRRRWVQRAGRVPTQVTDLTQLLSSRPLPTNLTPPIPTHHI